MGVRTAGQRRLAAGLVAGATAAGSLTVAGNLVVDGQVDAAAKITANQGLDVFGGNIDLSGGNLNVTGDANVTGTMTAGEVVDLP